MTESLPQLPVVHLPVEKLRSYWLNCGEEESVTITEIRDAIADKRFQAKPLVGAEWTAELRNKHIERIAFLVVNGWEDPIEIDVGCPTFGCYVNHIVIDGNHRLAAAIFCNNKTIAANIGGQISHAEELFDMELEHLYD